MSPLRRAYHAEVTRHAVRAILSDVSSAVSILCAVVTVVCLLGVWGTFAELRRLRADVAHRDRVTVQLVGALREALGLVSRVASVVQRGEPPEQFEHAGRGQRSDREPRDL